MPGKDIPDHLGKLVDLLKIKINLDETSAFAGGMVKEGAVMVGAKVGETTGVAAAFADSSLAKVAEGLDGLTDHIVAQTDLLADDIVKESSEHLKNAVGRAARKADDLVEELVEDTERLTKHIAGGMKEHAGLHELQNVMGEIEKKVSITSQTLEQEWMPEWKDALETFSKSLGETVNNLHGLELFEEDENGIQHEHGMKEWEEGLMSAMRNALNDIDHGATSKDISSAGRHNDSVKGHHEAPSLTGSSSYRKSFDNRKADTIFPSMGGDVHALHGDVTVEQDKPKTPQFMKTQTGSNRHVASLAVALQEAGLSEESIRQRLEQPDVARSSSRSPRAAAISSIRLLQERSRAPGDDRSCSPATSSPASGSIVCHEPVPTLVIAAASRSKRRGSATVMMMPLKEDHSAHLPPPQEACFSPHTMLLRESWRTAQERVREIARSDGAEALDLIRTYGHLLNNEIFMGRYVTSRDDNVEVAARKVLAHFEWRREYQIDSILDEDWSDLDSTGELMLSGVDKDGHSGWIWKLSKHDPRRTTAERSARYVVCMMERAMLANRKDDQRINAVCDCTSVSPANLDLPMLQIAFPLMQEQYPEVQIKTIIFPSGWVTMSLWAVINPLMAQKTKKKFKFLSEVEFKRLLQRDYDIHQVDPCYGGTLQRGPLFSLPLRTTPASPDTPSRRRSRWTPEGEPMNSTQLQRASSAPCLTLDGPVRAASGIADIVSSPIAEQASGVVVSDESAVRSLGGKRKSVEDNVLSVSASPKTSAHMSSNSAVGSGQSGSMARDSTVSHGSSVCLDAKPRSIMYAQSIGLLDDVPTDVWKEVRGKGGALCMALCGAAIGNVSSRMTSNDAPSMLAALTSTFMVVATALAAYTWIFPKRAGRDGTVHPRHHHMTTAEDSASAEVRGRSWGTPSKETAGGCTTADQQPSEGTPSKSHDHDVDLKGGKGHDRSEGTPSRSEKAANANLMKGTPSRSEQASSSNSVKGTPQASNSNILKGTPSRSEQAASDGTKIMCTEERKWEQGVTRGRTATRS